MHVYSNTYFKYNGEWKEGITQGIGTLTFGDGTFIEGEVNNFSRKYNELSHHT